MKLDVIVLHNMTHGDMFFGYKRTSKLAHAHTFHVEADSANNAAELIWILTNIDDANELRLRHPHLSQYADQVTFYRERRNRSTSIADVVVVMEGESIMRALACATLGWSAITPPTVDLKDVDNHQERSDAYAERITLTA